MRSASRALVDIKQLPWRRDRICLRASCNERRAPAAAAAAGDANVAKTLRRTFAYRHLGELINTKATSVGDANVSVTEVGMVGVVVARKADLN